MGYSRKQLISLVVGALAVSFALVAFMATYWQPRYASNDDALLASLPSGSFSGVREGQMIFIGPMFGYPLAWAFQLAPSIPWYFLLNYGTLGISLATLIVTSFILSRNAIIPVTLGAIALWFGVYSQWFLNLNFSVYAFALASGGFLLYLLALGGQRGATALIFGGSILIGIGGTLRDTVFPRPSAGITLVLMLLPSLVLICWQLGRRKSLTLLASLGVSTLLGVLANLSSYRGPTWTSLFNWYNTSSILDTPARKAAFQFVGQSKLSLNDYVLYYMNGWLDRNVYTNEVMNEFYDLVASATGSGLGLLYDPKLMWENFLIYTQPVRYLLIPILAILIIGLLNLPSARERIVFLTFTLISLVWLGGAFFYLGETRKVAPQVLIPATYALMLLVLLMPPALSRTTRRLRAPTPLLKVRQLALALVPLLVLLVLMPPLSFSSLDQISNGNRLQAKTYGQAVSELKALDSSAIYISICCSIEWGDQNPKKAIHYEDWPVQIVGGWPTFTPMWERRNEMLGIADGVPKDAYGTTDLVQALISNPKVRLIATEQAAGALSGQMKQYRGWQGCLNPIHRLPNDAFVYQAIQGNCATAPPAA